MVLGRVQCQSLILGEQVTTSWSMLTYWGVVDTMDHEVVQRPCRRCGWLLNLSWDHFGVHIRKEWPWSSRSPKDICRGLHTHWLGPTGFVMGEAKEVLWEKIGIIIKFKQFFLGIEDKDKRMATLDFYLFF